MTELLTFRITGNKGDFYIKEFKDTETCKHFIVNTLDLSKEWSYECVSIIDALIYLPRSQNGVITDYGYVSHNDFVKLLRKYKTNPDAIQYLADMLE